MWHRVVSYVGTKVSEEPIYEVTRRDITEDRILLRVCLKVI
jgi:hypothetical protein